MKLIFTLICTIALVGCYDPKDAQIEELEATVQEQKAAIDNLLKADQRLKASCDEVQSAAADVIKSDLELKRACGLK